MKCNVCGGNLISNKDGLLVCEFCGNVYQDQSVSKELESQLRSKSKNESIKMLELAESMKKQFYDSFRGREIEVLAEQKTRDGRYHSTAANYMEFFVESDTDIRGQIVKYKVK